MNGIRNMRLKTAGMVTSAVLVILLLAFGGTVTAISLTTSGEDQPQTVATTGAASQRSEAAPVGNARGSVPAAFDRQELSAGDNSEPLRDTDPEPQPEPSPEPKETPEPEPLHEPTPQPASPEPQPDRVEPVAQTAPEFISTPPLRATVGQDYVYIVEVKAAPAAVLSAEGLPVWLKLEDNLLHGTPAALNASDRATITLTAANGVAPDARQRFEISVDAAPEITSTPDTEAVAGKVYSYKVELKAEPKATLRLENAPNWLTLSGETVSGTPDRADAGETNEIKLIAGNGVKPDAVQTWTITVQTPPQFEAQPVLTVKAGETYEYEIKISGSPKPKLETSKLPDWLKLEEGKLSGKPRLADIGTSKRITLTADNGVKPAAKQSFKIEVENNPDYLEVPWTIEDAKEYVKVGMRFTWSSHRTLNGNRVPRSGGSNEWEVSVVDEKGFSFKPVAGGPARTVTWEETIKVPIAGSDVTRSEETVEVNGRKVKCVVYSSTQVDNDKDWTRTRSHFYAKEYPFLPVKDGHVDVTSSIGESSGGWSTIEKVTK